jgi:hypothetical protein
MQSGMFRANLPIAFLQQTYIVEPGVRRALAKFVLKTNGLSLPDGRFGQSRLTPRSTRIPHCGSK